LLRFAEPPTLKGEHVQRSRRDFLSQSARFGLLLGAGVPLLQACGGDEKQSSRSEPIRGGLQPEKGPLRIYNFVDYVSPEVIADFEAKYGVKVEITTFASDTEAATKLASGAVKVDVHHSIANYTVPDLIEGGHLLPLTRSYIDNRINVMAGFVDPWYDPGGSYTVPYTFFGTGISYRTDEIDPAQIEEQGWDALWQATDFKGRVSIIDDAREAISLAMMRRGTMTVDTADQAMIDRSVADLKELIDLVNVRVSIDAYKDIPEGRTAIAQTWSADMITGAINYLPDGTDASVLGFWHPPSDEYLVNNDNMAIAANAENPVLAHLYINFLLDSAVAEKNFSWLGYLPAISQLDGDYLVAQGYVPEQLRSCVPTDQDLISGLEFHRLDEAGKAKYAAAWATFQAALTG